MTSRVEVTQPSTEPRSGLGRLLASTGVSMIGQGTAIAAVPLLAASVTTDPLYVSIVAAASYVAWVVVGLPAGALVDRWPRRKTMVIADLFRATVLAVLGVTVVADWLSLPMLVVAVLLIASASCFFDPAAQAVVPLLVGTDQASLARANGRMWTLDVLGRSLVGPPLGAALFAFAAAWPFALNAATFIVSAVFLTGLSIVGRPAASGAVPQRIRHAVWAGVRYLAAHRELRLLTLGMATYNLGYNVAFATFVLFAKHRLGVSDRGFGLLLTTLAVGGIAGGWIGPRLHTRLRPSATYALCLGLQGGAWLLTASSHSPWIGGLGLLVVGLASTVVSVVGGTARQSLTPNDMIGRMTAATRVVGIGAAALGSLLGGVIAQATSLTTPLVVAAGLLGLGAAAFAVRAFHRG
jgi:MFS family permease